MRKFHGEFLRASPPFESHSENKAEIVGNFRQNGDILLVDFYGENGFILDFSKEYHRTF